MAQLVALGVPLPGRRYPLVTHQCVVGRARECDLTIDDQRVSRRHARVVRTSEGLCLEDLGSANGTFLNGRRVHGQAALADRDEILIGSARFALDLSDERSEPVPDGRVTILDARAALPDVVEVANLSQHDTLLRAPTVPSPAAAARQIERLQLKLRTLYKLGESVASALEPRALLRRVVELLLDVFPQASSAAAVVLDPKSQELRTLASRRRDGGDGAGGTILPRGVVDRVLRHGHSVLLRPAPERASSPEGDSGRVTAILGVVGEGLSPTGFRMGAPLSFKGRHLGILHVEAVDELDAFTQADLDLLGGIAAQAGVALHLAELHQRQLVQDRIDKDLVIARQIQRGLLPREPPRVSGMTFAVHYEPAFHVGGDFYDYLWLGPSRLGLVVGDVSGKAISGALFMARVASEFRAVAMLETQPHRLLQRVNRAIAPVAEDGMFCTTLVAAIDLERHVVRVANAGHPVPLLRRAGRVIVVDDPGARTIPLGVENHIEVGESEIALEPGDLLLLYTDGLLEARAADGTFYGMERLTEVFAAATGDARGVVDTLLRDLDRFVQDAPQSDDQTVVCVSVSAERSLRVDSMSPPSMPTIAR